MKKQNLTAWQDYGFARSFQIFRLIPKYVHLLQAHIREAAPCSPRPPFDMAKPSAEAFVGLAQSAFGVHAIPSHQVDNGKK